MRICSFSSSFFLCPVPDLENISFIYLISRKDVCIFFTMITDFCPHEFEIDLVKYGPAPFAVWAEPAWFLVPLRGLGE